MPRSRISPPNPNRTGNLAFLIIVIASYVMMFGLNPFPTAEKLLLLALGLAYLTIGTLFWSIVESSTSRAVRIIYFATQIILGGVIMYIGKGSGWLILLPVVSHAIIALSRRWAYTTAFIILAVETLPYSLSGNTIVLSGVALSFLAAIVFVTLFTETMLSEQHARQEVERMAARLGEANQRLSAYAAKAEELATAQERNRLAREIHDGLGHYLTSMNMQIKAAQAVMDQDPEKARDAMGKAQSLAQEALADVRRSVAALRTSPVENRPLPQAIARLVEDCKAAGVDTSMLVNGEYRPLSAQAELALYRAAQEGLTNVQKHARASQASVLLDYFEGQRVRLIVRDNGEGAPAAKSGYGLVGLRERAQLLGGQVRTESSAEQGFTLEMEIPC